MFKYLWKASFDDGHLITQPTDDRYSKHDDSVDHNPSAFRDILDYQATSPIVMFSIQSERGDTYAVSLTNGEFFINGSVIMLDQPLEELADRKLIYFRTNRKDMVTQQQYTHAYSFGYEGKDAKGKTVKKIITIQ